MKSKKNEPKGVLGIIHASLNDSFSQIKKSKFTFFILFLTQTLFIGVMGIIFYNYAVKIMQYREAILAPLNSEMLGNVSVFASESAGILENYSMLVQNLLLWLAASFFIYLFLNGINWEITYALANKRFSYFRYLRKFITYGAVCIIPSFILIVILLNTFIEFSGTLALIASFIIWAIMAYFMYVSFALIDNKEMSIKYLKKHCKKTIKFGTKHWKSFVLSDIMISLPIIADIILIALFAETAPMPILIFLLLIPPVILNMGRLVFINIARRLDHNKK